MSAGKGPPPSNINIHMIDKLAVDHCGMTGAAFTCEMCFNCITCTGRAWTCIVISQVFINDVVTQVILANTKRLYNIYTMLDQR